MLSAQQLTTTLNAALQKLWRDDASLFVDSNEKPRTIHERTVVAKHVHYLHCESQKYSAYINNNLTWNFEYNRQSNDTETASKCKQIAPTELSQENTQEWKRIFPDLILHERNTRNNCCVIEVKCKPSNSLNGKNLLKDYQTLIGMLQTHHYLFAISLIISSQDAYLIWILGKDIKQSTTIHINKSESSSEVVNSSYGEYVIYYSNKLPQCAKNALASLTNNTEVLNNH